MSIQFKLARYVDTYEYLKFFSNHEPDPNSINLHNQVPKLDLNRLSTREHLIIEYPLSSQTLCSLMETISNLFDI